MSVFIPDLGKRKHMRVLIESAIISLAATSDKRIMVLSIGLGLIASLTGDMYDTFCEYRRVLTMAQYHMDLYYFYDYMYRHLPKGEMSAEGKPCRIGIISFLRGMDYLFYSSRAVFSIYDIYEENMVLGKNWGRAVIEDLRV